MDLATLGAGGERPGSGWQESHWCGLWGPKRLDEWASAYEEELKVPVSAMAWGSLLRALQALGWAALAECKFVWKVFCKLRAGESAEVAASAKQVAARARQKRWRETEQLRAGTRETKRAKAAADKERARRLREELDKERASTKASRGASDRGRQGGGGARCRPNNRRCGGGRRQVGPLPTTANTSPDIARWRRRGARRGRGCASERFAVVSKEGGEQHVPIGYPSGGNSLPRGCPVDVRSVGR